MFRGVWGTAVMRTVAVVGCAGVPAAYGGFETLAENLAVYRERHGLDVDLTIFCSGPVPAEGTRSFHGAHLRYLPLSANGVSSIAYDAWSLMLAWRNRADAVLLLGVSGAIVLPLLRGLGRTKVVTNIDGIEWRRAKWGRLARAFLRLSEWLAVRCSHVVVADNEGVAEHVVRSYGRPCTVIAYGGDHAVEAERRPWRTALPPRYALALCRIEPENNVEMILDAFARHAALPLVFVGNWESSAFGREMRGCYGSYSHITLADPEYDPGALRTLREGASLYVHGHSAGGTNPSLVEAMHFGVPVAAYDCVFNRHTTQEAAWYFADAQGLAAMVIGLDSAQAQAVGGRMRALARRDFTWERIGAAYFQVLG
jgi:glycosyltransferase involved in cell wall biosynthesis